jgi:hypothetical protein
VWVNRPAKIFLVVLLACFTLRHSIQAQTHNRKKEHAMMSVRNAYSGRQDFYSKEEAVAFLAIVERKSLYSDTHPHLLAHYLYKDWRNQSRIGHDAAGLCRAAHEGSRIHRRPRPQI